MSARTTVPWPVPSWSCGNSPPPSSSRRVTPCRSQPPSCAPSGLTAPRGPRTLAATTGAALEGLVIGTIIATALAAITVLVPFSSRTILRVAVAFYSLPIVALAPILQVRFSDRTSSITLAALAVVFVSLVSTANGLTAVPSGSAAICRGFGGTAESLLLQGTGGCRHSQAWWWACVLPCRARSSARSSASSSAHRRGLGQLLVNYESQFQTASTWATAVVITLVTAIGYGLIGALSGPLLRRSPPVSRRRLPPAGRYRQLGSSWACILAARS